MRLADSGAAVIADAKLSAYLLDVTHPRGGPKAIFFLRFGFAREEPERLRTALLAHAVEREVIAVRPAPHGLVYKVRCAIRTPDGRDPCITSVWMVPATGAAPQLVTAVPGRPARPEGTPDRAAG